MPSLSLVRYPSLNRYGNIHAYDHSRVVLACQAEGELDYINANYVLDRHQKERQYIASQGPTEATTAAFWSVTDSFF